MKLVITCLLAIYVLLLSCVPCQDEAVAALTDHSGATTVQQAEGAHSEAIDLCSPFCICACCASVTIVSIASVLPETNLTRFITSSGFSYLQPVYGGDLRGIWQPPKIVA